MVQLCFFLAEKQQKEILFLILAATDCISISAFASLVCVLVGITSSAVGLKICAITPRIKMYKSVIRKKKKKRDRILVLGKDKLNTIEVLIDSYISHDQFVSVNNVLRKYYEMKKEIKNPLECTIQKQ